MAYKHKQFKHVKVSILSAPSNGAPKKTRDKDGNKLVTGWNFDKYEEQNAKQKPINV